MPELKCHPMKKLRSFSKQFPQKYPTLKDAMGGLRVYVHAAGEKATQNCFHNGWKCNHFISNLFLFFPDGIIRACYLNAPGCMHFI